MTYSRQPVANPLIWSDRTEVDRVSWQMQIVIALLPIMAALGTYLLPFEFAGISLYAFRVLILIAFPLGLLLVAGQNQRFSLVLSGFFGVGGIWIVWGTLSLFWSPLPYEGFKELIAIAFGLVAASVMFQLKAYVFQGLVALRWGWIIAYLSTGLIAVWEVASGDHLPGAYVSAQLLREQLYAISTTIAVVISTFENPDTYAIFIAAAFPFLLWAFMDSGQWYKKLLYLALLSAAPILLALTECRTAVVIIVVQLVIFTVFNLSNKRVAATLVIFIAVASILFFSQLQNNDDSIAKFSRVWSEYTDGGSTQIRVNLILDGLWFTVLSYGIGIGAGGYEAKIVESSIPWPVEPAINPHNLWIEVMSQYGLLIFALFVAWFGYTLIIAFKARNKAVRSAHLPYKRISEICILTLVGYAMGVMVPGTYLPQPVNWIWLGSIAMQAQHLFEYLNCTQDCQANFTQ